MAKGAGSRVIGTQRCFLLSSELCGKHLHGKGRWLKSHWNSTLLSPFIRALWKTPPWQRALAQESLELNAAFSFHPSFVENTTMARGAAMKKAAAKAAKKMMFGKEVVVKAKPAKSVVKAFAVA